MGRILDYLITILILSAVAFVGYMVAKLFHLDNYIRTAVRSFTDSFLDAKRDDVRRVYIIDNIRENLANASGVIIVVISKLWGRFKGRVNYARNHYHDVEYQEVINYKDVDVDEEPVEPVEVITEEDEYEDENIKERVVDYTEYQEVNTNKEEKTFDNLNVF